MNGERGWKEMTGVTISAAKEVCCVTSREMVIRGRLGRKRRLKGGKKE